MEENAEQDDGKESLNPKNIIVDERVDVEGTVVRASIIEAVRECISELGNEEEKYAILLYYIGNKSYREIGRILGKSTSMARNRKLSEKGMTSL